LASRKAELGAAEKRDATEQECLEYGRNDPQLRRLAEEIAIQKMIWEESQNTVVSGANNPVARKYLEDSTRAQRKYEERLTELKGELKKNRLSLIESDLRKLEASITQTNSRRGLLEQETSKLKEQTEVLGNTSIEVEMIRNDLRNQERAKESISEEREKIKAELKAPPRIVLLEKPDKNDPPRIQSNLWKRAMLTVFSSGIAFALSVLGVGFWDLRRQRINSAKEVTERLGLPVIGSVPMIPARVLRQMGTGETRHQIWQIRLTESVDGITARLLRRSDTDQRRVVMITSAMSGEGKTTLAAQIAISLARSGRRTALVDFDLRQPSLDEIFNIPRSPGVCEILRNEHELAAATQATATPNLCIIPAGQWNRLTIAALANGAAAPLFKELREDFDFVILDTSPILPVADARFVSQYADSTVLSIFRDVSEMPRLQAACEILQAFGVHTIEAVVTGSNVHLYGRHIGDPLDEMSPSPEAIV
jgi:polysaccharide biosynthesis transport protein